MKKEKGKKVGGESMGKEVGKKQRENRIQGVRHRNEDCQKKHLVTNSAVKNVLF